ncbi:hypothetical protein P0D69_28125 [Paraburkholderia sediminicola]|uniref:hypothetical protein n=1 Tax=Paraburkholderia sediminicola TaxID=458836 RepID=UPI0038B758C6
MATENNSPTNESLGSANPTDNGGEIGGALSENDLASYLNKKTDSIPKAEKKPAGEKKMLSSPFEPHAAGGEEQSDINANESEHEDVELDLTDLDSDSTDTNASEDNDSEAEPTFEIQVDGKKFEVKQSELIADAQKYRASGDKFKEASDMRKEADEIKAVYSQERNTLKDLLAQYQNFIETSYKEQQPDWQQLLDTNPVEYIRQKEYWQAKQAHANQAKAYQEQIRTQEAAEQKVKLAEHLKAQQQKVFELFPSWKNPETAKKAASKIESYLEAEGFSQEERDGLADARLLMVAHKAALYDQLVKANTQKKATTPSGKTLNAGTATTNDPSFSKRQAQTAAAREAKSWNDTLKSQPTQKNLEAYLANQWAKKK